MLTVDLERLGVKKGDRLLDSGCGFGRHSFALSRQGVDLYPLDIDTESLHKTRFMLHEMRRTGEASALTRFLVMQSNALSLPFKESSFDCIICAEVMEHVDDDSKACAELSRVLKQGGRIAITVPTRFSELIYHAISFEYFSTPGGHVRIYRPKQLAAIMRNNGLEIYHVDFRHSFHTLYWMIKGVVGLHRNAHPIPKAYHSFLTRTLFSRFMKRAERLTDFFFPKSIILYAWKK